MCPSATYLFYLLVYHQQWLSYISGQMVLLVNGETQTLQLNGLIFNLIGKCHLEDYIVPKQSINTVPNPGSLYIVYMEKS